MALEFHKLETTRATGTLDGALPFQIQLDGDVWHADIASRALSTRRVSGRKIPSTNELMSIAHHLVAKYREGLRFTPALV